MNRTSMLTNIRIDGSIISGWDIKRHHVDFLDGEGFLCSHGFLRCNVAHA